MIEFKIPGKPIAKKRPRFFRRGNYVGTYNDQRTEEGRFMLFVKEQFDSDMLEGPIDLWLRFYFPIPKSTPKKHIESMRLGFIRHTKRPDLDNCIKFVKDCLNELVWKDDSQICRIEAVKLYGDEPMTEIRIFS